MSGRYLQRRDALNRPLPADELKRLLIDRGDTTFDALPAHGAAQVDLDQAKLARYLALFKATSGENPQELLRSRGILTPDRHGRRLVPTHAGILLFGKDVTRFLPQAEMILVRYPGRQPGDQFLRQDIRTTLPEAVHEALMWLLSNMRKGARLSGLERQDVPEYPPEAVREALVNAVAHRDYTIRGEGVRVIMFSDRIEFYSPGRLPGHVTVDNIEDERFSRNPIVVQALADLGLIEKLGYGINRMIRLMGEWRLPAPVFKETAGGFLVTLMGQGEGMRAVPLARTMEMWLRQGLNERQIAALAYLSEHGTITNREYRELYPDVTDETVRRDLADLVDRDLIIKVGDKRATYYILK
jgi:ATP-dependent DNA helicase RecG